MGISYDAYVAYGVRIPVNPYHYDENGRPPAEQVDQALSVPTVKAACPDVGHVQAGAYDRDMFFLVTECHGAELGQYIRIGFDDDDQGRPTRDKEADWDRQLRHAIEIMGWSGFDLEDFGWLVVADES